MSVLVSLGGVPQELSLDFKKGYDSQTLMAPARPYMRFRYFKHFIQLLGGIITCTPAQLQIVKEGSEAFNGYSFGERKNP